jgi:hypothetical protein
MTTLAVFEWLRTKRPQANRDDWGAEIGFAAGDRHGHEGRAGMRESNARCKH